MECDARVDLINLQRRSLEEIENLDRRSLEFIAQRFDLTCLENEFNLD